MASSDDFAKIKTDAEAFYKGIIKVRCPALNADVHFSVDGFHHLRYDGSRAERAKNVQRNKLSCIREAVCIIQKTTTIQEYRTRLSPVGHADSHGFRATKLIEYYAFQAITDVNKFRRINVVVRRVGNGNFHFWSVMPSWKEERINASHYIRSIGGRWMFDT